MCQHATFVGVENEVPVFVHLVIVFDDLQALLLSVVGSDHTELVWFVFSCLRWNDFFWLFDKVYCLVISP